jgi:hypothetical protein
MISHDSPWASQIFRDGILVGGFKHGWIIFHNHNIWEWFNDP